MSSYAKNGTDPSFGAINTTISNKIVNGTTFGAGNITGTTFGAGYYTFPSNMTVTGNTQLTGNTTFDNGIMTVDSTNNRINITTGVELISPGDNERNFQSNGTYMTIQIGAAAPITTGLSPVSTKISYWPFITGSKRISMDRISIPLVSWGNVSTMCNLAIYNDTGNINASTLKWNGSALPLINNTVLVNWSISPIITMKSNSIYWIAYQCNASGTIKLLYPETRFLSNVLGYNVAGSNMYTDLSTTATYNGTFSTTPGTQTKEAAINPPFFIFSTRTDGEGTII
jgi:hypothetical protein